MNFKPMLACKAPDDLDKIVLPVLASPKLDGIRCIIKDGVALSRKLLPIPNKYVQAQLSGLPPGIDGELMLSLPGNFNEVQSAVMSIDGEPDFTFCVFDWDGPKEMVFHERFRLLSEQVDKHKWPRVEVVPHTAISTRDLLEALEDQYVKDGFEGIMLRSMQGPYKYGRSTEREGYLLKLKRFSDAEAATIGFEELMHNDNAATKNELGQTKRSSNKEGKRAAGKLGALICQRDDKVKFNIGAGFTDAQRVQLWSERDTLVSRIAKYKFQPDPSNPHGAPRFPVFLGFRSEID